MLTEGPAVNQTVKMPLHPDQSASKVSLTTKGFIVIPCLILLDAVAIGTSLLIAYLTRIYALPWLLPGVFKPELLENTLQNLGWLPFTIIACMAYEDLYQKRMPFWKEVEKILKASTLAVIFSISLLYLAKMTGEISRTLVMITWLVTIVLIPTFRYFGKLFLIKMRIWSKPVLIIGAGKTGELILRAFTREDTMGYKIIGFLDDNKEINGLVHPRSKEIIPKLGTFDEAESIILASGVQEVIVAAPGLPAKNLVELTNRIQPLVNNVMLVPDLFGISMNGIEVEYFFDEQALLLNVKNKLKSNLNKSIKRAFDIMTGSIMSLLCMPIMFVMAAAIKIDSKGPVFFAQERLGQNGAAFTCYKFRTMYIDGDKVLKKYLRTNQQAKKQWQTFNKLKDYDPRVTKIGSLLRRFSLDELPQLINVIMGDMSLVGPRPYLPRERKQMGNWIYDIHVAKPGITGLWQVSGRNEIEFEGRLKLDTWYVRNWSLWLDIILLIKTIRVVLRKEGAY
ncbi:sugar transferase [Desulforamulus ruminis]|uniref:Exopolysaccharide biosynthesis polyprenyl glycosylphosphotransferase n=1 Tax=Desulforamulus ruminis (strain ATCC 23193 / DSM 2154 / NCIMB 8452 / DL) TaxID=696281 RepID=F6DP48_DESRL|nr:exopolysaccharide biosynthesis polyprenyl glycosylphosphotransferase [Desulforamulus ruminis DSM 2154]